MDENLRFLEAFEYLKQKGLISSYVDFATQLDTNKAAINDIKSNRKRVSLELLSSLKKSYPDIDIEYIITGDGELIHTPTAVPVPAGHGIPLIPTSAMCGFGSPAFDDVPVMGYYSVPEFKNADFLIGLIGDSMTPRFVPGDIVACKIVKETLFFQWNKIYAIYTGSQGVMVKRVKQSARDGCILLVSDNPAYDPFDVPLSDITALALVIGVIRVE